MEKKIKTLENAFDEEESNIVKDTYPLDYNEIPIPELDGALDRAKRFNTGKPKWHLVHMKSLTPLVRVMEFGATKYEERNWMKPMDTTEILNSLQRHLNELNDGNEIDEESKQHHIGHIMANAMMYSYHKKLHNA